MTIENEIVQLLKQGDTRGISILYDNYSGSLLGIVSRIIPKREVAEEVLQDVFVKVWDNAEKYDAAKGRLFTWLAQITRNAALDRVRSASYRKSRKTDSTENSVSFNESLSEQSAIQDSGLRKVVSGLDESHRTLIDYAYFQGYTQSEIAKELDIPLGTVKTRIRAAIKELRKILGREFISLLILLGLW